MKEKTFKNKNHWYDGEFYDKVVAPNQTKLFHQIKDLIPEQSTVIDVGCGTGHLSFMLADKCRAITGVDLSRRNIAKANKKLKKSDLSSLEFFHSSLEAFNTKKKFDYSTITYVLHEIDAEDRQQLIKAMFRVADKVIIGDYMTPQPKSFSGLITYVIEFIAGRNHFKNFRNFQRNGGLHNLIEKGSYKISNEIRNETNMIFVLSENSK